MLFVAAAAVASAMAIAIVVAVVTLSAAAAVTAVIAIVAAMVVVAIVAATVAAAAVVGSSGLSLARLAGQPTPRICLFLPSYYWQFKWMPPCPADLTWVLGVGFRFD